MNIECQAESEQTATNIAPKNEEKTYFIFNYFEKNHTLLFACVSVIVTLFSIYIGGLAYVYQNLKLQGWGVSIEGIQVPHSGRFYYYVVATLIFWGTQILLQEFWLWIIRNHRKDYASVVRANSFVKVSREFNRISMRDKVELKDRGGTSNEDWDKRYIMVQDQKKQAKIATTLFVRGLTKNLIICYLFAIFYFFPALLFYLVSVGKHSWVPSIGIWCIGLITTFLMSLQFAKQSGKEFNPKSIRKEIREIGNDDYELFKCELEKIQSNNNTNEQKRKIKDLFCDSYVKLSMALLLLILVFSTFLVIVFGMIDYEFQKQFWIYTDLQKQYVVVFQDEKVVVLKEAEIEGDTVTINMANQRVVETGDLELVHREFSKVIRADDYNGKNTKQ